MFYMDTYLHAIWLQGNNVWATLVKNIIDYCTLVSYVSHFSNLEFATKRSFICPRQNLAVHCFVFLTSYHDQKHKIILLDIIEMSGIKSKFSRFNSYDNWVLNKTESRMKYKTSKNSKTSNDAFKLYTF